MCTLWAVTEDAEGCQRSCDKKKAERLHVTAPKLIAVTILTSMDAEQYAELNYKNTIAEQVAVP
jgi:orotidine-5'-phosphate decarboxylase